jgi:hypothetical protein
MRIATFGVTAEVLLGMMPAERRASLRTPYSQPFLRRFLESSLTIAVVGRHRGTCRARAGQLALYEEETNETERINCEANHNVRLILLTAAAK